MNQPVIGVALNPSAPLGDLLKGMLTSKIADSAGAISYVNCKAVEPHESGFLRLVPVDDSPFAPVALLVPPSYILWMVQAEREKVLGFITP